MTLRDGLGEILKFDQPPKRVISLVPSITEWLVDVRVDVIGRTKFCIHPKAAVQSIPLVGGTKNFRFDTIKELNPDLIIGNKEENYQEGIDLLKKDFNVWMTEIGSFQESITCFDQLSTCLEVRENWGVLRDKLNHQYRLHIDKDKGTVVYLIWQKPYMAIGDNTFVNSMLSDFGYKNLIKTDRYPEVTMEEVIRLNPEFLLLSSEPYPFKQKHVEELQSQLKSSTVKLVNGEYYSWYGTRLLKLREDQVTGEY